MIQINNKYKKLKIFINHYDSEKTQLPITIVSNFKNIKIIEIIEILKIC